MDLPKRGIDDTWTPLLGRNFTQISNAFLKYFHKLKVVPVRGKNARGMNCTEAMALVQLISFKWGTASPYPSLGTVAETLGINVRSAREAIANLERSGYVKRERSSFGGTNRYRLDGLFKALEAIVIQEDLKALPGADERRLG